MNLAGRVGSWSAAHWKTAFFGWVAFVVAAFVVGNAVGARELADSDTASGEAAKAEAILEGAGFENQALESVLIQASGGARVGDAAFTNAIVGVVTRLQRLASVDDVHSPLDRDAEGLVSEDRTSALVQFEIVGEPEDAAKGEVIEPVLAATAAAQAASPGFRIEQFGEASASFELDETIGEDFVRAEVTSVPLTLVILIVVFGALVAAVLPVMLGFTGVIATLGLMAVVSRAVPLSEASQSVVLLIGMAVGVDYSLFYLRREREERAAGNESRRSIRLTAATSGQAVLISGGTVVIAMAGMLLAGNAIFTSIGVGAMIVVLATVVGSLMVLPALLSKLGDRVEYGVFGILGGLLRMLRLRRLGDRVGAIRPRIIPWRRRGELAESRFWTSLIDRVTRRPLAWAVGSVAALVALALPAVGMHTKLPAFTDLPRELAIVGTYERLQAAFPGSSTPAAVVIEAEDVTAPPVRDAIAELRRAALATGRMSSPIDVAINPAETVAVVDVPLAGQGDDDVSFAALESLREDVLPGTIGKVAGADYAVTGLTAGTKDFNDEMKARAPIVFVFVLGLAFVLMLVTFRSIVIPIKAIVLNLLSVAASYGILVLLFQHGWGESILGFESNGAITSWLPLFLFVVLFGLSMDYHVFILARVKELVDRGMPTDEAVKRGIAGTAATVTAAAVVMVAVFSIFATLRTLDIKQMGVGLAVAVLLDATVIRGVLLPAAMKLLGDWNWYLPRSLSWLPALVHAPEPPEEPVEAPPVLG